MSDIYEQLRKRMNEINFPEGIPLEFGCEFISPNEYGDNSILLFCSIYDDTGNTRTLAYMSQSREMTYEIFDFKSREESKMEVLGKELSLQDLIVAIKSKSEDMLIDGEGLLYAQILGVSYKIELDLSIPIKKQDPEALKQLLSLIS